MAHNIADINGTSAMAYLDSTPWHGLGENILKLMQATAPEGRIALARKHAQLDYQVETEALQLVSSGELVEGHKATVRVNLDGTRTQLGVVGEGYQVVQNSEATELLEVLAREWGAVPATAAALGSGERAFMLMRLADAKVSPVEGDDVRGYFLLHWSHGGQTGVNGRGTPIRVVCQNTLSMATAQGKDWISIRHSGDQAAKLDQAAKIMGKLMQSLKATGETFASMARKQLSAQQLVEFIDKVIPNTDPKAAAVSPVIQARRETVARLIHSGRGAAMANQLVNTADGSASLWGAYNAVTEYMDHVRPAEAQSDAGRARANESAIFGGNSQVKAQALAVARELVAV